MFFSFYVFFPFYSMSKENVRKTDLASIPISVVDDRLFSEEPMNPLEIRDKRKGVRDNG